MQLEKMHTEKRRVTLSGIHVTSEIGKLKKVCLHRPGDELLNLPPFELERLLFDDVPYLEVAQAEHDKFAELMQGEGVEILYLEKMVAEIFDENPALRAQFLDEYLAEAGIANPAYIQVAREKLESITDNLEFVNKTIAGLAKSEVDLPTGGSSLAALAAGDDDSDLIIDPMPNLYFQRDPFACIGEGVSLNRMYSVTRNRETLYGKYLFKYHKDYAGTPLWYDRDATYHIEGGDILNLTETALAIGVSQRTQAAAIDQIAQNIFWKTEGCKIEKIFAFDIPNNRAMMHLDTVFTQIDIDKFTIHPAIMGTLRVWEMTRGAHEGEVSIKEHTDSLERILDYATGVDGVQLIPCGGGDPIAAAREQWNDGSNTLAVAPGTICVYQRNNVTNEVLDKAGLKLLVVPSAELSRGRGGPRCMSMPFVREDL